MGWGGGVEGGMSYGSFHSSTWVCRIQENCVCVYPEISICSDITHLSQVI